MLNLLPGPELPGSPPYETVAEELRCAAQNGQTFRGWTDAQIAEDLVCCSPACEDYDSDALLPHVQRWRRERELDS